MNLFNTDWKNYVGKGEKVSLMTQTSNKFALIFLVVFWIIFFIVSILAIFVDIYSALICFFFFALPYLFIYFVIKSRTHIITNKGILEIKGVFVKSYKFVPFIKITDTRLHRNILDLIFGTGSIDVSTAGGTRMVNGYSQPYEIRFLHVDDFMKVHEQIKKSIK